MSQFSEEIDPEIYKIKAKIYIRLLLKLCKKINKYSQDKEEEDLITDKDTILKYYDTNLKGQSMDSLMVLLTYLLNENKDKNSYEKDLIDTHASRLNKFIHNSLILDSDKILELIKQKSNEEDSKIKVQKQHLKIDIYKNLIDRFIKLALRIINQNKTQNIKDLMDYDKDEDEDIPIDDETTNYTESISKILDKLDKSIIIIEKYNNDNLDNFLIDLDYFFTNAKNLYKKYKSKKGIGQDDLDDKINKSAFVKKFTGSDSGSTFTEIYLKNNTIENYLNGIFLDISSKFITSDNKKSKLTEKENKLTLFKDVKIDNTIKDDIDIDIDIGNDNIEKNKIRVRDLIEKLKFIFETNSDIKNNFTNDFKDIYIEMMSRVSCSDREPQEGRSIGTVAGEKTAVGEETAAEVGAAEEVDAAKAFGPATTHTIGDGGGPASGAGEAETEAVGTAEEVGAEGSVVRGVALSPQQVPEDVITPLQVSTDKDREQKIYSDIICKIKEFIQDSFYLSS